jgi:hypothetical protein
MADRLLPPPPRPVSHEETLALGTAAALAAIHAILRRT